MKSLIDDIENIEMFVDDVEKCLNSNILSALGGGGGDPGRNELTIAAEAFKLLKRYGMVVRDGLDIRECLEGDNIYNENFLEY